MIPPLKPIPNYPGYSVSRDGAIYSSRNSRDGTPKEVKVSSRGTVTLNGYGWQKVRKPMDVAREVWKIKEEKPNQAKPMTKYVRASVRIMEEEEGIATKVIIGGYTYVLQT